jgi:hypothetical protein
LYQVCALQQVCIHSASVTSIGGEHLSSLTIHYHCGNNQKYRYYLNPHRDRMMNQFKPRIILMTYIRYDDLITILEEFLRPPTTILSPIRVTTFRLRFEILAVSHISFNFYLALLRTC